MGKDTTVLLICVTVFLSYLPEAGQYSSFFLYLKQVIHTHSHMWLDKGTGRCKMDLLTCSFEIFLKLLLISFNEIMLKLETERQLRDLLVTELSVQSAAGVDISLKRSRSGFKISFRSIAET